MSMFEDIDTIEDARAENDIGVRGTSNNARQVALVTALVIEGRHRSRTTFNNEDELESPVEPRVSEKRGLGGIRRTLLGEDLEAITVNGANAAGDDQKRTGVEGKSRERREEADHNDLDVECAKGESCFPIHRPVHRNPVDDSKEQGGDRYGLGAQGERPGD